MLLIRACMLPCFSSQSQAIPSLQSATYRRSCSMTVEDHAPRRAAGSCGVASATDMSAGPRGGGGSGLRGSAASSLPRNNSCVVLGGGSGNNFLMTSSFNGAVAGVGTLGSFSLLAGGGGSNNGRQAPARCGRSGSAPPPPSSGSFAVQRSLSSLMDDSHSNGVHGNQHMSSLIGDSRADAVHDQPQLPPPLWDDETTMLVLKVSMSTRSSGVCHYLDAVGQVDWGTQAGD